MAIQLNTTECDAILFYMHYSICQRSIIIPDAYKRVYVDLIRKIIQYSFDLQNEIKDE